jgi:hypothetical protein
MLGSFGVFELKSLGNKPNLIIIRTDELASIQRLQYGNQPISNNWLDFGQTMSGTANTQQP